MTEYVHVQIRLDSEIRQQIRDLAQMERISFSELVRQLINEGLWVRAIGLSDEFPNNGLNRNTKSLNK